SGTNSAIRELGGVLGISVLGAIFAAAGGYASGTSFVGGLVPAVSVGAVVVGVGAIVSLFLPGHRRGAPAEPAELGEVVGVLESV
ncbi:MAG: transrane efflux protein, partial [Acidimicrobiaceae bacterium]|nr:transrane efflux protein [Acidimicrobiaceae bacterium]